MNVDRQNALNVQFLEIQIRCPNEAVQDTILAAFEDMLGWNNLERLRYIKL